MSFPETVEVTKTEQGSLTYDGDPHVYEAEKAVPMTWGKTIPAQVSAREHDEHANATFQQADRAAARLFETLPSLLACTGRVAARIAIKAKGRILLIDAAEVIAVEAKGNYVLLHHRANSHMLRETIATMQEKLNPLGFVRIHRSALVNAALVEEIQPWSTGEYVIRMRSGREYTVTRTYKKNMQFLAHLWIGMSGFDAD